MCSMSKITISAVLTILRLALTFLAKSVNLIYTIIDLVDDGCRNNSVEQPEWVKILATAIDSIQNVVAHFSGIEDELTLNRPANG